MLSIEFIISNASLLVALTQKDCTLIVGTDCIVTYYSLQVQRRKPTDYLQLYFCIW